MRSKNIEARLERLESVIAPLGATVIVQLENGQEIEVSAEAYLADAGKTMTFLRMSRCTLENLPTVDRIIDLAYEEAWSYAQ